MSDSVAVVIIGRNEGDRLRRCLKSLINQTNQIVYVDSGSTDDSVNIARMTGATVLSLDINVPFTAARARNEGFERMHILFPQTKYVQFVDGDCEVSAVWLENAYGFLELHQDVAVVCGRRRELHPNRTIYNMLCDIEWDTPIGEANSCGGDAMMRVSAFEDVKGFRSSLIAGEEPELCVRLRALGWKIWRLDIEMTLHDAAMTSLWQWWKRSMRGGYAFAEGAYLHGAPPERHRVTESRRALIWGLGIPLVTFGLAPVIGLWCFAVLLVYPFQVIRLAFSGTQTARGNWWHSLFLVLGKFPEAIGQLKFIYNLRTGKVARLIEYK